MVVSASSIRVSEVPMVHVESYIRSGECFVPVSEHAGRAPDESYIEGAVELVINGVPLLGTAEHDYVDQLWTYLADGLIEIAAGRPFSTFLPDQPVEVSIVPSGPRVTVTVTVGKPRSASADRRAFLDTMAQAARIFFGRMCEIAPGNRRSYEETLAQLDRVAG
jgi:hypothetical protein